MNVAKEDVSRLNGTALDHRFFDLGLLAGPQVYFCLMRLRLHLERALQDFIALVNCFAASQAINFKFMNQLQNLGSGPSFLLRLRVIPVTIGGDSGPTELQRGGAGQLPRRPGPHCRSLEPRGSLTKSRSGPPRTAFVFSGISTESSVAPNTTAYRTDSLDRKDSLSQSITNCELVAALSRTT
jgi:hypothetical protein